MSILAVLEATDGLVKSLPILKICKTPLVVANGQMLDDGPILQHGPELMVNPQARSGIVAERTTNDVVFTGMRNVETTPPLGV